MAATTMSVAISLVAVASRPVEVSIVVNCGGNGTQCCACAINEQSVEEKKLKTLCVCVYR